MGDMSGGLFEYSVFRIIDEIIRFLLKNVKRSPAVYSRFYSHLHDYGYTFSTNCQQKMWKIQKACHVPLVLLIVVSFFTLFACAQGKGVERFKALPAGTTLIGMSEEEVRQKIGAPDVVSKTPENKILWRYRPAWKVIPSPKDMLYVEFENGKVVKVFTIR
jgi:hypothetical protein